jgi:hypothetical protein
MTKKWISTGGSPTLEPRSKLQRFVTGWRASDALRCTILQAPVIKDWVLGIYVTRDPNRVDMNCITNYEIIRHILQLKVYNVHQGMAVLACFYLLTQCCKGWLDHGEEWLTNNVARAESEARV